MTRHATGVTMNLDRGGVVTFPHATIRRYERDNGRSRKRGVLLGLLAGGVGRWRLDDRQRWTTLRNPVGSSGTP